MLPSGFQGRIFGVLMEWLAEPNYRWVTAQLAPFKPQSYLEIGFGTGRLAELIARRFVPQRLCGVDPSALMLAKASRRLEPLRKKIAIDLRLGNDASLPWNDTFDAIVATHSFQFWSDPQATLQRLRAQLSETGHLVLVLRRHISKGVYDWLPNPIAKSGDELAGTRKALADAGFRILRDSALKTGSHGILAACA
jgi:ubiquinone/menaquinone biosynthesis C-methylase UbiE